MEEFLSIVKEIAPDVAAAVVTSAATCVTAEVTGRLQDKNTSKRINALSEEDKANDDIVLKIVKGEATKRKVLDLGLFIAEAVAVGAGKNYICDTYLTSEETAAEN